MKKLLSILLSVIMAMSVIIIPTSVSAKKAKTVPNTYVPSDMDETGVIGVNVPNKGIVYKETYKLVLKKTNGKLVTLDKYNRTSNSVSTYYIRGNSVYYGYRDKAKKNYKSQIRKVDLDGKNKTTLYSKIYANGDAFYLIGGYGSGVIFSEKIYNKKNKTYTYIIKMIRNKKVTTLFKVNSKKKVDFKIFSGKVFYNNKSYDLAKGKSTSYVAKRIYITKNYMYYINKNNNLKSLDKKDVRRIVTKNVYKYYNANHSNDVVYSKLNKNKEEVFYHRAGTSKENKLCTWGDIYKTATNYKTSPKVLRYYKDALLHNGKFYLSFTVLGSDPLYDTSYITEVNLKNGKPIIYEKEEFTAYISMWTFNNKLEYQGYGTENDGYDSED
ncbi:hypothetical protein ACTQ2N_09935 [Ruminococcus sp. LCP21S3_E8]